MKDPISLTALGNYGPANRIRLSAPTGAKATGTRIPTRHMLRLPSGGDLRGYRTVWHRVFVDVQPGRESAPYVLVNRSRRDLAPELVTFIEARTKQTVGV